jgi:hypothetical protein
LDRVKKDIGKGEKVLGKGTAKGRVGTGITMSLGLDDDDDDDKDDEEEVEDDEEEQTEYESFKRFLETQKQK